MFRQYYSDQSPSELLEKPSVLSVISCDGVCSAPNSPGLISTGLTLLSDPVYEVIESPSINVIRGVSGRCHWSQSQDICVVAIWLSAEDCRNIESSTESAYLELLTYLSASGFPYPFRFWNFIPGINQGEGDSESYKKFCVGRLKAFSQHNLNASSFPAASALGHHTQGAVIYALASRDEAIHYENPLQESAYRYPRQYGPSSPSFARASKITTTGDDQVFISGTASILGHETQSPGDLFEQLDVTLKNIDCLTRHVAKGPAPLSALRVYLRHSQHYDRCRSFLESRLQTAEITYTLADICRSNLLVEIEAHFPTGPNV